MKNIFIAILISILAQGAFALECRVSVKTRTADGMSKVTEYNTLDLNGLNLSRAGEHFSAGTLITVNDNPVNIECEAYTQAGWSNPANGKFLPIYSCAIDNRASAPQPISASQFDGVARLTVNFALPQTKIGYFDTLHVGCF